MEKLFKRHFEATRQRGKVHMNTKIREFFDKMHEEDTEVLLELEKYTALEDHNLESELWDAVCVRINLLQRLGFDLKKGLEKNVIHQETRKD